MARLYSDLKDSSSRRYFYDLEGAPGIAAPALATLTINGLAPTILELTEAFRTPAPATLTINGLSFVSDLILTPAPAALSLAGQIPGMLTQLVISLPAPSLDYATPQSTAPTIIFVNTITPTTGLVSLGSLELNVTPGGNIAYISPSAGAITLNGIAAALPRVTDVGLISISGLVPSLLTVNTVSPDVGSLSFGGFAPSIDSPFTWIDVDAPPPLTWTTTTGISA